MSYSLLDKTNLYLSFGVCIGDFSKLSNAIDSMSPSVVEYFLSSMILSYNEECSACDINFNDYIQVGDYLIYKTTDNERLYLKTLAKNTYDDNYETGSLF